MTSVKSCSILLPTDLRYYLIYLLWLFFGQSNRFLIRFRFGIFQVLMFSLVYLLLNDSNILLLNFSIFLFFNFKFHLFVMILNSSNSITLRKTI